MEKSNVNKYNVDVYNYLIIIFFSYNTYKSIFVS